MKKIRYFLLVLLLIASCKTVEKEKVTISNKNSAFQDLYKDNFEGFYFIKDDTCLLWLYIKNDNSYILYNDYHVFETGTLKIIYEDEIFLKFKEFNAMANTDTIKIQNYGNTSNEFEHFPFCNNKYIELIKNKLFINDNNIVNINNAAYYIVQSSNYIPAIFLLEKIIGQYPNRTVAYLNLGDAYWGLGEQEKAKTAYNTYISQMKRRGKERNIPDIVVQRVRE